MRTHVLIGFLLLLGVTQHLVAQGAAVSLLNF